MLARDDAERDPLRAVEPRLVDQELHRATAVSVPLVARVDHESPDVELACGRVAVDHHEPDELVARGDRAEPRLRLEVRLGDRVRVGGDVPLLLGRDGERRDRAHGLGGDLPQLDGPGHHRAVCASTIPASTTAPPISCAVPKVSPSQAQATTVATTGSSVAAIDAFVAGMCLSAPVRSVNVTIVPTTTTNATSSQTGAECSERFPWSDTVSSSTSPETSTAG